MFAANLNINKRMDNSKNNKLVVNKICVTVFIVVSI